MKGWRLYILVLMTFPPALCFPLGQCTARPWVPVWRPSLLVATLPNVAVVEPIPQSPKGYFA